MTENELNIIGHIRDTCKKVGLNYIACMLNDAMMQSGIEKSKYDLSSMPSKDLANEIEKRFQLELQKKDNPKDENLMVVLPSLVEVPAEKDEEGVIRPKACSECNGACKLPNPYDPEGAPVECEMCGGSGMQI